MPPADDSRSFYQLLLFTEFGDQGPSVYFYPLMRSFFYICRGLPGLGDLVVCGVGSDCYCLLAPPTQDSLCCSVFSFASNQELKILDRISIISLGYPVEPPQVYARSARNDVHMCLPGDLANPVNLGALKFSSTRCSPTEPAITLKKRNNFLSSAGVDSDLNHTATTEILRHPIRALTSRASVCGSQFRSALFIVHFGH